MVGSPPPRRSQGGSRGSEPVLARPWDVFGAMFGAPRVLGCILVPKSSQNETEKCQKSYLKAIVFLLRFPTCFLMPTFRKSYIFRTDASRSSLQFIWCLPYELHIVLVSCTNCKHQSAGLFWVRKHCLFRSFLF